MITRFLTTATLILSLSSVSSALSIVSATPQAVCSNFSQTRAITISFDAPICALGAPPPPQNLLKISPAIPGTLRWQGTSGLEFTPTNRIIPSGKYSVGLLKGIKGIDGSVLQNDYWFGFSTPSLRVESTARDGLTEDSREWYEPLGIKEPIYIYCNLPVDLSQAGKFIKVASNVPFEIDHPLQKDLPSSRAPEWYSIQEIDVSEAPGKIRADVIRIRPKNQWSMSTGYSISLKAGLKSGNGGVALDEDWNIYYETVSPLTFEGFFQNNIELGEGCEVDPRGNIEARFNNPVPFNEIAKRVHFSPAETFSQEQLDLEWTTRRPSLGLGLKPNTSYRMTIDTGLTDAWGSRYGTRLMLGFHTAGLHPSIKALGGYGTIESKTSRRMPLDCINAAGNSVYFWRLSPDAIVSLSERGGLFDSDIGGTELLNRAADKTVRIGSNVLNQRQRLPIVLDSALSDSCGLLLISVRDTLGRNADGQQITQYRKALTQVTNLGIAAKFGFDNTLIAITSLDKALPLAGTKVQIRDALGAVRFEGTTNDSGLSEAPSWKQLDLPRKDWEMPHMYVVALRGSDKAVLGSHWNSSIDPWRFNINYSSNTVPSIICKGTVITERDLYRPGDTLHAKGIVRMLTKGEWKMPPFTRVAVSVVRESDGYSDDYEDEEYESEGEETDDKGVLFSDTLTLRAPGNFNFDCLIPATSKLASYTITATLPDYAGEPSNGTSYTSINGSFRVAEFRAAELEVAVTTPRHSGIQGDSLHFAGTASYLFGSPVSKAPYSWVLRKYPLSFNPEGYEDWSFENWAADNDDNEYRYGSSDIIASGEDTLDAKGMFRKDLAPVQGLRRSPQRCEFQATVTGNSATPVSGRNTITMHPVPVYPGVRVMGIAEQGKSIRIDACALNTQEKPAANESLAITILRRTWHSVRKAGVDGRWYWESTKKDSTCLTTTLTTDAQGRAELPFTPRDLGSFVVFASRAGKSGDAAMQASTMFYASGPGYAPWQRSDDNILELVPDKKKYAPGEEAKILVKSPFAESRALITVEREGVIDRRWVDMKGSATVVSVPLRSNYVPNVFVSVLLIRGRLSDKAWDESGEDLAKPAFRIGYCELPVNPSERHLAVDLKTDKDAYRPSDSVQVTVDAKSPNADLLVMAVDEGVLLLTGFPTPDPFNLFYEKRQLSVLSAESRGSVIGEREYNEKGKNRGGGGGLDPNLLAALSDISARKKFAVCAYFNAKVSADAEGKAHVSFKLPENLTTFRVMAVAADANGRFGADARKVRVNMPYMVRPLMPRFLRNGDSLCAGFTAQNATGADDTAYSSVTAPGLSLASSSLKTPAPQGGTSVAFAFRVPQNHTADTAVVTFKSKLGANADGAEVHLPLLDEHILEVYAADGSTLDSALQTLAVPADARKGLGKLAVSLSSTALVGLGDGVNYLFEYPYGCLEQRTSRVLPIILYSDMVKSFGITALGNNNEAAVIKDWAAGLKSYQTSSGGFDYWQGGTHPSVWLSAYALQAMVKAEKKGYAVDADIKSKAVSWLSATVDGTIKHDPWYSAQYRDCADAFTLSVLAEAGQYKGAMVERLFKRLPALPLEARAQLYKAVIYGKGDKTIRAALRTSLLNSFVQDAATAHVEEGNSEGLWWCHQTNTRSTAMVLEALLCSSEELPAAKKTVTWLMMQQKHGRWNNTQENFYAFWAMAAYVDRYEKDIPDFKAKISLDGKQWFEEIFSGRTSASVSHALPLDSVKNAKAVHAVKTGPGRLYYTLRLRYAPGGTPPALDAGFSTKREYLNIDGTAVKPADFVAGKTYLVKVTVSTNKDRSFVALNDPIPAGCEIIDPSLASADQTITEKTDALASAPASDWWWGSFTSHEFRDSRCLVFADYLTRGTHTYGYAIRATVRGSFRVPATLVEELYEPEVFGRGIEEIVNIK